MELNKITELVIGCAIEVHRELGPGLLESTYEACFAYELQKAGLNFRKQLGLPLVYKEIKLEEGYRLDIIVENRVVVEIKAVEAINDIHIAQTLTYLKLTGAEVALIINFNVLKLTDGIKRLVPRKSSL
ncbi:MAG: GxxExxY protein [Chitinophagaceae bacterium]|nr:GxxExxY protein [Chitinophagaceae bacterium]